MNEITITNQKQSLITLMAGQYNMEPAAFSATVRSTCMPNNVSNEEFAAFLMVAKEYGLNPLTREIYAFPKKGGGVQPIVSIDGWMNLINSHPQCDGMDFNDDFDDKKNLISVTCSIHRKDRSRPTCVTEYMDECKRPTEPWSKWPKRMLRHKSAIQCARYAFGFAGIIDPDEAERSPEVLTQASVVAPAPIASAEKKEEEQFVDVEPIDTDSFLAELEDSLAVAKDAETVNEIWDAFDALSVLDGLTEPQNKAIALRDARLEAVIKPFDDSRIRSVIVNLKEVATDGGTSILEMAYKAAYKASEFNEERKLLTDELPKLKEMAEKRDAEMQKESQADG